MAQPADRPRAPWFRAGPDLGTRVSDADRAQVADRLARHFADGRLDQAELDERVTRAMTAKTVGDLQGLFDDLPGERPGGIRAETPDPGPGRVPGMPPGAGRAARRRRGPGRGLVRTLLIVVLVLVAANIAWHALGWMMPLVWVAVIVAIIMLVSKRARRLNG